MNYLTYGEYIALGGVCEATAFNRYIIRANSAIDSATLNRVKAMTEVPLSVKACCCDIVEYYATNASSSEKSVASWTQSAGAVSESVSYIATTADDVQNAVSAIITDYLGSVADDNGTPLLYLGATK